jgi:DNA-binding NtrC family response regulator
MMWRVLVVDDDVAVCATLEHLLKRAGNEVRSAVNVSHAFQLAEAESFDLLISDLVMPQQDGVAVIRRFRTMFPRMPIVAMSGGARLGTPDTLAAARGAGADELLRKPFTMESLMAAAEAAMAKEKRRPEGKKG